MGVFFFPMNPKLRSQILAEFRGYWEPKKRPDRCFPVGDVLGPLLKKLGLGERMQEEEISRTWSELVGEFLSNHSKPDRLKDGILYVRVLQPTLLFELDRVWKPEVLRKLKAKYGPKKVKDVRFRAG